MKNKLSILSISFMLMISVCTVGCMNKQQTKEEIYDDFNITPLDFRELNRSLNLSFPPLLNHLLKYVILLPFSSLAIYVTYTNNSSSAVKLYSAIIFNIVFKSKI